MSSKAPIVLLLVSIMFIAACGSDEPAQNVRSAFLGGTQGVVAEFEQFGVEESGTYSIFDSESFPLEVTIKNKGEYTLKPGDVRVRLLGPSRDEIGGVNDWELQNQDELEIISELLPQGGEETITFASDATYTKSVKGFLDREWFANIDYRYQTQLIVPQVCLKEDLTDDRVCEVRENKEFFVSGAPLTITRVEQDLAGKGIMALKIAVKKEGSGKLTPVGEEFGIQDKIAYSIDDPLWECKSGGRVNEAKLVDGQVEIICKLRNALAEDELSTKQVQISFDYQYRDIIQEKLRIKESLS